MSKEHFIDTISVGEPDTSGIQFISGGDDWSVQTIFIQIQERIIRIRLKDLLTRIRILRYFKYKNFYLTTGPVPIFYFLLNISNKNEWPEPKPANQFVSGNFYSDPVRFGLPTLALISDRVQKKPGSRFGNESVFRLEAGSGS